MCKSVWVLSAYADYEAVNIMGIYDSKEKAESAKKALDTLISAEPDYSDRKNGRLCIFYDGCNVNKFDVNRGWQGEI